MSMLPLPESYRQQIVDDLFIFTGSRDPLDFLEKVIFKTNSDHIKYIDAPAGRPLAAYYRDVIRYCEISAWAEEPPLILALLKSMPNTVKFAPWIASIAKEGPFRCHPPGKPVLVARVAAELPLFGRKQTRLAAKAFDHPTVTGSGEPKRVLRVYGGIGKSYTLNFFRYLAAIQPEKAAVLHVDFGDPELITQAADRDTPIELLLARKLEAQARAVRQALKRREESEGDEDLELEFAEQPYTFESLTNEQQRVRWTRQLARNLVDHVLSRYKGKPQWWIAVFDNCKSAAPEAQEFVRRLVENAAGTGPDDFDRAVKSPLRVVLLGESDAMLPSPVHTPHIWDDDLSQQKFGLAEAEAYFRLLAQARRINLDAQMIGALTRSCLTVAENESGPNATQVQFVVALAKAVVAKAIQLEAATAQQQRQDQ